MDNAYFTQLLGMAAEKQQEKKHSTSKFISTRVAAAKKEPKQNRLSSNIKNFLARQEAEAKAKEKEEKEKTKALLALRSENKESSKAARRMLKMTKSVNKAVVEEALNTRDTADTLAGRNQCDEDDYGYESTAAKGLYEKLMNKYEANPEDPMAKFSKAAKPKKSAKDITATMARVKDALSKGDPDMAIEKAPRSSKSSSSSSSSNPKCGFMTPKESERVAHSSKDGGDRDNKFKKPMSSKPAKPKISFSELMKQAKQNASGGGSGSGGGANKSIMDEMFRSSKKTEVKDCEFDRPMTEKEKQEYRREKLSQARKDGKGPSSSGDRPPSKDAGKSSNSQDKSKPMPMSKKLEAASGKKDGGGASVKKSSSSDGKPGPASSKKAAAEAAAPKAGGQQQKKAAPAKAAERPSSSSSGGERQTGKLSQAQIEKMRARGGGGAPNRGAPQASQQRKAPRDMASVESRPFPGEKKPRDFASVESRAFPGERGYRGEGSSSGSSSSSSKVRERKRSPSRSPSPIGGGGRKKFNPNNMSTLKRRRIESDDEEEEEDSDMDDFIDDSEAKFDISAEIRGIFGYDRRKFRDEEPFDDRAMENNSFAKVMKEEAYSAKIGMQEDLEDIRREEEEKRRKMQRAKSKNRR